MIKYLKIYYRLAKFAFIWETTYRFSFLLEWLVEAFYLLVTLLGMKVIFWNVQEIAGWNFNQVLVLIGLEMIFTEILLGLAFIFNLRKLPERIATGYLDLVLLRPINSQFVVSLWQPYFALLPSLIPGFLAIYFGFQQGGFVFNPFLLLPFLAIFISGLVIAYSVGMILTTLSFWLVNATPLPKMAEEILFMSGRPYSIYSGFWKVLFLFFIPLAFMVSFPAQTLMGDFHWWWPLLAVGLAVAFLKFSNFFWRFGLRYYSGASS